MFWSTSLSVDIVGISTHLANTFPKKLNGHSWGGEPTEICPMLISTQYLSVIIWMIEYSVLFFFFFFPVKLNWGRRRFTVQHEFTMILKNYTGSEINKMIL